MNRPTQITLTALALGLLGGSLRAQGFDAETAVKRMRVPPGFHVRLVASEPEVRQPVTMSFDGRGRLWVIQYLQYPTPAGLRPVKVDQYLRTVYDKVPEPPPRGPRGADRITILEDAHSGGRFRKVRDFATGLNLASGMALGHGGVFVAQPPYLLFYPDRNGDDVPDGDPEVLLTGFGTEDAHAFANSLQWGPDGWLYGAQGSTVTAHVRGVTFQQGIWRYHPVTRAFELFSEGGGNTWGLDFNRHGNAIAGTNYGNAAMLHQVQGAYYVKNFGKHGELQNPYAFGYFDHVPYSGFRGGHVTCGGIVYRGGSFPHEFTDTYIAANPLSNALFWHVLEPHGSTFSARFGGELLDARDTWFRPVDCLTGPDGSLFVADWYDKRINHVDPVDNWDRSNGRIYKIEAEGTRPTSTVGLDRLPSSELVDLLKHQNSWFVGEARRVLAERRDPSVVEPLRRILAQRKADRLSLEALWALYVSGGFDDIRAGSLLCHPSADVRVWTVRLLGDAKNVSPVLQTALMELARSEKSVVVRCQLACTCKRLPGPQALPIVRELLRHDTDASDPFIPLLLWWAIEDKAASDRDAVLGLLDSAATWRRPLQRQWIVERLARRYMASGADADFAACARLLAAAPTPDDIERLIRGMDRALEGRRLKAVPPALASPMARLWRERQPGPALVRLALRLGDPRAEEPALRLVMDRDAAADERARLVEVLGQVGTPGATVALLQLLRPAEAPPVQLAALSALANGREPRVPAAVLAAYPQMSLLLRARARSLLFGRPDWSRELLQGVQKGRIDPKEFSVGELRTVLLWKDDALNRIVEKYWGQIGPEPPGEKIARIRSVGLILSRGKGSPEAGRLLFQKHCATCHTLFGEGGHVGPDLTTADRKNREFLVTSVVDPSAVVRREYLAYVATTASGRIVTGVMAESNPRTVTLLTEKNERVVLAREDLEELRPSPQSLMPERLLDTLDDQQICDLFSYLQRGPK